MQPYFRYATLFQPDKMFHTKKKIGPNFFQPLNFFLQFQFFGANIFVEDQYFWPPIFYWRNYTPIFFGLNFSNQFFSANNFLDPNSVFKCCRLFRQKKCYVPQILLILVSGTCRIKKEMNQAAFMIDQITILPIQKSNEENPWLFSNLSTINRDKF